MNNYLVRIEKQEDGTYIAYNIEDDNSTLIGTGKTVKEAREDFLNSVEELRRFSEEDGIKVPEICFKKPVFKFDLSSLFEYYSSINVAGFAKFVGINATLLRQYKKGNTYISEKQLQKIEDGIHKLGEELVALKLV